MNLYDSNVKKVMAFLAENNYSPAHISLHRVCYREFRSYLLGTNQVYSMEQAIDWIDSNKPTWTKARYLGFQQCLEQLEYVYHSDEIQLKYLFPRYSAYKQLIPSLVLELDTYLEYRKATDTVAYIDHNRFICSRFLLYIQEHGIHSLSEISYTIMLGFYKMDFYRSQKHKDWHEGFIRKLIHYYAQTGKCSIGFSLILNKLLIHKVIFFSDMSDEHVEKIDSLREESLHFPPTKFWDACREFQCVIEKYRYANTMRTCSLHTLTLLFIFLDMHHLGYTPEIAWIWYEDVKPHLKTNWAMSRRVLKLFEQFVLEGDITPQTTYTYKPTGFDQLPIWCKEPLSSFLKLKMRESIAKSTITMYRSANARFCFFLVKKGMTSFKQLTPEHIKEFNLMDVHETLEGKNAYNVRIKAFIAYLEEQGILKTSMLYQALPSVFAPRERVVNVLSDNEIAQIHKYKENSTTPLELRNIALILLGLKMGLRASDIVNLQFLNIDWKRSLIHFIQEKTKTEVTLPMPTEVGNAIYRYLMSGRPTSKISYIFIQHKAPYVKLKRHVCLRAIKKILPERNIHGSGFHVTRKSFATTLLRRGTEVNTIIDSLGHRTDDTVSKYLSLDEKRMRTCSLSLAEAGIMLRGVLRSC